VDTQEISRQLGADFILEGSVRKAGNRVRISAQLVDASIVRQLWAERYDHELNDIFAVQDDVTQKIVAALQVTLGRDENIGLRQKNTTNLEAYDCVLRGLNVSRSVGPVLAGFLILSAGPAYVFLLNTFTFLALLIAIYRWPDNTNVNTTSLPVERFMEGMRAGLRYAQHAPMLQAVLIKGMVFFFFGSAIWALLPVIAVRVLNGGPTLYGWLIASIGIGAVVASQMMGWLNKKYSRNTIVTAGGLIYAATLYGFGNSSDMGILLTVLFFSGASWLALFSTIVVAGQLAVPDWVRARGLALVMLTMMGSMSLGSAIWGKLADQLGIPLTCTITALGLALSLMAIKNIRIGEDDHIDLTPSMHWPTPEFADDIRPDSGPVMVTIEYTVSSENKAEFLRLSRQLKQLRKRDGAFFWELFSKAGKADCLVEVFMVNSWLEHLRQHTRVTVVDKELQDKIRSLLTAETKPKRTHFIG